MLLDCLEIIAITSTIGKNNSALIGQPCMILFDNLKNDNT